MQTMAEFDIKKINAVIAGWQKNIVEPATETADGEGAPATPRKKREPRKTRIDACGFVCTPHGIPLASVPGNIPIALDKLGYVIRKNEFKSCIEITGEVKGQPFDGEINDDIANWIRHKIEAEFRFLPSTGMFLDEVANVAFCNSFHPVRDYLNGLPQPHPSVKCEELFIRYAGAEDTELNRAFARLWMTAAVRRIMHPGFKFDTVPIIESVQGKNKSLALALLAVKPAWFTDSLPLGAESKVIIEQTSGVWIVEFPEMTGHNSDVERIKAFTSQQYDKARMAYGHFPLTVPRQWVGCISKNPGAKLQDAENRRFWPVEIKKFDLDALGRDRDLLWADAVAIEATGASVMLEERLWGAAREVQRTQRVDSPFADKLAVELGIHKPNPGFVPLCDLDDELPVRVSMNTVWEALNLEKPSDQDREKMKVNHAMGRLGFKHKRMTERGHPICKRNAGFYERCGPSDLWLECQFIRQWVGARVGAGVGATR
jgi:hypothetical protein